MKKFILCFSLLGLLLLGNVANGHNSSIMGGGGVAEIIVFKTDKLGLLLSLPTIYAKKVSPTSPVKVELIGIDKQISIGILTDDTLTELPLLPKGMYSLVITIDDFFYQANIEI